MPVNAAKHARQLKQIKKVQDAIRYRDAQLERLKPVKEDKRLTREYFEQIHRQRDGKRNENRKLARKAIREDWELGPLRPNRAVGEEAEAYGILQDEVLNPYRLPQHWVGAGQELQKQMKRKLPENVLHDQWPVVKDDRVVIIRGKDKNKIGTVAALNKQNNSVLIEGLNKTWYDADNFPEIGEMPERKMEREHFVHLEDIRLVFPWESEDGTIRDVVVEKVTMERHKSGWNHITLRDDPNIPEEHAVFPETDEPVWKRYIGYGTHRQYIPWPWELPEYNSNKSKTNTTENKKEVERDDRTKLQKFIGKGWIWGSKSDAPASSTEAKTVEKKVPEHDYEYKPVNRPKEDEYSDFADDTSGNTVERTAGAPGEYFEYALVERPFPASVSAELKALDLDFEGITGGESVNAEAEERERREQEEWEKAILQDKMTQSMKSPAQLVAELRRKEREVSAVKILPDAGAKREEIREFNKQLGNKLMLDFANRMGAPVPVVPQTQRGKTIEV